MGTKQPTNKTENKNLQNGAGEYIVNNFIEDVWKVMTPPMVERMKQILTHDFGLSKTDTDNFIRCQRYIRRRRVCLKKTTREIRIGPRNQWIKELSKDIADQIAIFVVSILLSERNDRTKKLAEHVLDRLCDFTGEDTTIETAKTRVERILVVVADRLASWINENVSEIELELKEKLVSPQKTLSGVICAARKSLDSLQSFDLHSKMSNVSEDVCTIKDSLVTFDSEVLSVKDEGELSSDEMESYRKGSEDEQSSERSDAEEDSEDESDKSATGEESKGESTNDEEAEEEAVSEDSEDEGESNESEAEGEESEEEEESGEAESEQGEVEIDGEEEEEKEEAPDGEQSVSEEGVTLDDGKESTQKSIISEIHDKSESEITDIGSPLDILDLLRKDLEELPKADYKSERQQAIREVIDDRLKKIAQDKLKRSLDSVIRYDTDKTASIVANWVEKILATADGAELMPLITEPRQGFAFEVMRGDGSQLNVQKISSTAVAKQVAELRGLDPPIRKKKLPKTMSPINIKSMNDWADWALGAAEVGEEWDKWIDETLEDVERQLSQARGSKTEAERREIWKGWREKKAMEADKWRAEKQRIKAEGAVWNRKLQKNISEKPERETKAMTY